MFLQLSARANPAVKHYNYDCPKYIQHSFPNDFNHGQLLKIPTQNIDNVDTADNFGQDF
ncbi:MAG: hypothetical protein LBT09_01670 [Planctomycetaceae bacterium]|jgi:hypothetical protein|nr:hypothetical protein [Planctomycetaceae bacterium]